MLSSWAAAETIEVDVARNGSVGIGGIAIYDYDKCYAVKVRGNIRNEPSHGKAEPHQFKEKLSDKAGRCVGHETSIAGVVYRPDPGFGGTDKFDVNYSYNYDWGRGGGKTYRRTYVITVK